MLDAIHHRERHRLGDQLLSPLDVLGLDGPHDPVVDGEDRLRQLPQTGRGEHLAQRMALVRLEVGRDAAPPLPTIFGQHDVPASDVDGVVVGSEHRRHAVEERHRDRPPGLDPLDEVLGRALLGDGRLAAALEHGVDGALGPLAGGQLVLGHQLRGPGVRVAREQVREELLVVAVAREDARVTGGPVRHGDQLAGHAHGRTIVREHPLDVRGVGVHAPGGLEAPVERQAGLLVDDEGPQVRGLGLLLVGPGREPDEGVHREGGRGMRFLRH